MAAVLIPVITNAWLGRTVASSDAVPFANFADTLYGQAKGGVRWTHAAVDHPELTGMTEPQRSQLLYGLAFEEIQSNPLGLAKGSFKAWTDFLLPGPLSAFGFLTFGNKTVDLLLQVGAILMFLAGLWLLWKNRKEPIAKILLLFWLGIFLSIPLLLLAAVSFGSVFFLTGRGGGLFSVAAGALFVASLASILSFISPAVYELPSHHCPFCILQKEYQSIGYLLYLLIFTGAVTGVGVGVLMPFRSIPSLAGIIPALQKRYVMMSVLCSAFLGLLIIVLLTTSNLRM